MSILSRLTLSSAVSILCFSSSVYGINSYTSSEDYFTNQIIPLTYKANKLGISNLSACDFIILPFLPNIACQVIEPIITDYLKEQATIQDTVTIETILNKKETVNILELGAKKSIYHFLVEKTYTREILGIESKTIIYARFKSTVKCGFDLNQAFDITIEHQDKKIVITFPAPTILSNEITMIDSIDEEGVFSPQLNSEMYNDIYESAKLKSFEYALRDELKKQAKENIQQVLPDILPPLISSQFGYNLTIAFEDEKLKINQEDKTH